MINMGIEPFLICSAVNSIISQRLLRRVCPACKQEVKIPQALYDKMGIGILLPKKDLIFFRGKGCGKCLNSGYSGRMGINEVLVLTPGIKKLILSRAGEIEIKAKARREGMLTLREDAVVKAAKGLTTLEEVVRVTAVDEGMK
jgi:type II secretory ATPase GspE/PulE/Tfp pilus assembly ATPase PilB-like protein